MNSDVPECIIDDYGTFKYIQILVTNKKDKNDKKIIIRGTEDLHLRRSL